MAEEIGVGGGGLGFLGDGNVGGGAGVVESGEFGCGDAARRRGGVELDTSMGVAADRCDLAVEGAGCVWGGGIARGRFAVEVAGARGSGMDFRGTGRARQWGAMGDRPRGWS